jgi:radical SAM-linked protein
MIVRVKFSKYGFTKFIGHLDLVRYFQKAIRRSGLTVAYSEGFNPHPLLYFAAPLGLGQTSDGEYMDVEFKKEYPLEEITTRLNSALTEGFYVQSATGLSDWKPGQKKESIMALTACADYMVSIKDMEVDGKEYAEYFQRFHEKFTEFLQRSEIMAEKESKKSAQIVDIRPMIFAWGFEREDLLSGEFSQDLTEEEKKKIAEEGISHAQEYKNKLRVFLKLSSGSVNNLKPELVMESFCKAYGLPYKEEGLQFHRMEIYGDLCMQEDKESLNTGEMGRKLVPLWKFHRVEE